MEDYLSESEQWERVKAWLRTNGTWIVTGVALGVLGLAGWNWWQEREDRIALEASSRYSEILKALDRGDKTRALTLTGELERDYASSPYVDQAHLVGARVAVDGGDLNKAATLLKGVMDSSDDPQLSLVARHRLARVQLAQGKPDEALATLNGAEPGAFEPRFAEVRGDILLAKGDKAGALKEYQAALAGTATQSVDAQTLNLKIADLKTEAPAAAPAPVAEAK